jgi:hypothetical protein
MTRRQTQAATSIAAILCAAPCSSLRGMCDVWRVQVIGCVARVVAIAAALHLTAASSEAAPAAPAAPTAAPTAAPPSTETSEARQPAIDAERDAARSAARIEGVRRKILDERYQSELPRYRGEGSGRDHRSTRTRRAGGELGDADRRAMREARREEPSSFSTLMSMVLWGMVVVVGVLVVFWLISELSRYGGDPELPAEEREDHKAVVDAIIERPLGDADELARRGLFAEAIHTLLLRTLQELVRTAAVRVAPAMTSREILARVPLLADARSAFAGLITAVEITHFGDAEASAADYERCRQQFHVFAAAFRGRAAQAVAA